MIKKTALIYATSLSASLLVGCGGDSADQPRNDPSANQSPIARITGPLTADERSQLTLNALQSSDADGQVAEYAWSISNTDNSDIQLEGRSSASLIVRIGELAEDVRPEIRLTVKDNQGASSQTSVTAQFDEVDRDQLPPSPGDAGQQSVAGVDSDNDGIRDDFERSILELIPLETERRQLLLNGAQAFQVALLSGENGTDTQQDLASDELAKFSKCLVMVYPESIPKELATLRTLMINTPERQAAYRAFNRSRAGTIQRSASVDRIDCFVTE